MWRKKTAQKELRENWFSAVSKIRLNITLWLVLYNPVLNPRGEAPYISLCGIGVGKKYGI